MVNILDFIKQHLGLFIITVSVIILYPLLSRKIRENLENLKDDEEETPIINSETLNKIGLMKNSIIMWPLPEIPTGWALCDGSNKGRSDETPDMKKFFLNIDNNTIRYIIKL